MEIKVQEINKQEQISGSFIHFFHIFLQILHKIQKDHEGTFLLQPSL